MYQLTTQKLRVLEASKYYSAAETREHFCVVCDDQVTAGELLYFDGAQWFHTCCVVRHPSTHHLHQLVTGGAR